MYCETALYGGPLHSPCTVRWSPALTLHCTAVPRAHPTLYGGPLCSPYTVRQSPALTLHCMAVPRAHPTLYGGPLRSPCTVRWSPVLTLHCTVVPCAHPALYGGPARLLCYVYHYIMSQCFLYVLVVVSCLSDCSLFNPNVSKLRPKECDQDRGHYH